MQSVSQFWPQHATTVGRNLYPSCQPDVRPHVDPDTLSVHFSNVIPVSITPPPLACFQTVGLYTFLRI